MPKNDIALEMLREAAVEVWEDLEDELLNGLIEGMKKRLQAVIDAGGWYTKY